MSEQTELKEKKGDFIEMEYDFGSNEGTISASDGCKNVAMHRNPGLGINRWNIIGERQILCSTYRTAQKKRHEHF